MSWGEWVDCGALLGQWVSVCRPAAFFLGTSQPGSMWDLVRLLRKWRIRLRRMWVEWGFGIPLKDWRRREQGDSGCLYTAAGVVQAGRMRSNLGNTFCFAKQVLWKLGFSVTLRPQFSYFRWMSKLLDNYDGMGSGAGRWKGDSLLPPSTYREQRLFSQVPSPHLLLLHWSWYPPHTSSAVDIVSGYTTCIWWRRALSPCDCMTKWIWQNPSCDGQLWMQDHLMSHNQMLCVSQGSTEQWLLVFEWDIQFSVTDGMALFRNPRGLGCDSSWGLPQTLHSVLSRHRCLEYHRGNCTTACTCCRALSCSGPHWKLTVFLVTK